MKVRALLDIGALVTAGAVAAPTTQATPDIRRGEEAYVRCAACHALAYDRVGPRHCGLFGRRAGTVPGFEYSPAMKASRIVWDEKSLDRFLAAPTRAVPGTSMTYDGVPDARTRADLIAYLRHAGTTDACDASTPPH